jgi:phenol 2-monooxygenase
MLTLKISDLHKTFIDDESYYSGHGKAYEKFGVNIEEGAVVVVRPDQCVLFLLPRQCYIR